MRRVRACVRWATRPHRSITYILRTPTARRACSCMDTTAACTRTHARRQRPGPGPGPARPARRAYVCDGDDTTELDQLASRPGRSVATRQVIRRQRWHIMCSTDRSSANASKQASTSTRVFSCPIDRSTCRGTARGVFVCLSGLSGTLVLHPATSC